jgi:hypothetical protein
MMGNIEHRTLNIERRTQGTEILASLAALRAKWMG